ncbi:repeatdomain containing protein [Pyrenophora tritici-repentis]|uniref:DUF2235 domain containing protein n=2 Tax=Pyrenophora tritici-repentis TaxID=45151 RepID=A0A2W1E0K3_9PLEO|nr:uncharacterized protein PTRG_02948 [Pyrenophora tritici-repentis Pt-1C-BFP]KAF7451962.1 DUF2235 domain containing protein [Pyrenophora tritici-repentis]EDU45471.1 conserved hypothetical protein [Pyrenophora tritici-repentis Pt-1C-BFP]KAF7574914.1 DUF2235 domain containing protein [Pyrenophora tritici-repentis]KAI0589896.1 DUF2235 domain-containing protein [Pyrenophora tritici-repentis]KAI0592349.1 DUF2235 domain-containing protein [Pyrenophora tritici-repentis]
MASKDTEQTKSSNIPPQVFVPTPHNNPMDYGAVSRQQGHVTKKFVLCFDGTGNKFSGTDADSNILKIYRMLDRNGDDQFHYYQPGIGTYVTKADGSMTRTGRWDKFQSWYAKAKDSAIGTSFDMHVMAGYRFLMRYYTPGDDIYFFGFSRGAYTARFLAEMLDHVGLLSAGNEEMCQFAWKTFQKWQCRLPDEKRKDRTPGEKSEKHKLLEFMCAFRETFSRPVKPIRFLGLFDTVNSVPAFENAWMQRSRFPYTARSSAVVIRHAVAIDERRAKFRQDLVSQEKPDRSMYYKRRRKHLQHMKEMAHDCTEQQYMDETDKEEQGNRGRRETLAPPEVFRNPHDTSGVRSQSRGYSADGNYRSGTPSMRSYEGAHTFNSEEEDQDIQEVWFPGCHADIGGGWPLGDDDAALSHVPLVWMVREAQKAGLEFDEEKLEALGCYLEESHISGGKTHINVPTIEVAPASPLPNTSSGAASSGMTGYTDDDNILSHHQEWPDTHFHRHLHEAATKGRIHDVLQFNNGATRMGVISWNIMEYLPFRRMDLQEDSTWKAIRWPLPKGETRDIPANAVIHSSVIKRMRADPTYRPGNLIVGGGGRGVRHAPKDLGMGKWIIVCDEGDHVAECFVRRFPPERTKTEEMEASVSAGGPQGNYFAGRKRSTAV